jgi:hypothetical protein
MLLLQSQNKKLAQYLEKQKRQQEMKLQLSLLWKQGRQTPWLEKKSMSEDF